MLGSTYRLIFEPSGGTSAQLYDFTVTSLVLLDAFVGGRVPSDHGEESDAGRYWTNYNSATFRRAHTD